LALFCGGINADPHPTRTNHSDNPVAYTHRWSPGDLGCCRGHCLWRSDLYEPCIIGLGALLAASALAFTALKWLGALYLIWLGINMLRTAVRSDFNAPSSNTLSLRRSIFYKLFWVTVLNPKSIGFFAAFLPQFIDPARSIMIQSLVMLATFVSFGALNAVAYGYAANHLQAHLNRPCIKR
jgi:threonine/homoserine/homoserine lactone efflux protein